MTSGSAVAVGAAVSARATLEVLPLGSSPSLPQNHRNGLHSYDFLSNLVSVNRWRQLTGCGPQTRRSHFCLQLPSGLHWTSQSRTILAQSDFNREMPSGSVGASDGVGLASAMVAKAVMPPNKVWSFILSGQNEGDEKRYRKCEKRMK